RPQGVVMSGDLATLAKQALCAELEKLRDELRGLVEPLDEALFWRKPLEPGNSAGHLVLHLTGNLSHYVGTQLGQTGYQRDRPREFTETAVPTKAEALARLDDAVALFRRVVEGLPEERLAGPHPEASFGTVLAGLVRLVAHFALHRGQVSYIVRLVQAPGG